MLASELITQLTELIKEHGDLEVTYHDWSHTYVAESKLNQYEEAVDCVDYIEKDNRIKLQ